MRASWALLGAGLLLAVGAGAAETSIVIEGLVPDGDETHFFLPFDVPAGTVEIEVRHDDLSSTNILDWGLDDPEGFRGWGGGKGEPAIVGLDAASPSYVPGPIPIGTWEVVVGKALIRELPARYAVEVILRTEPTLAPQPAREPYSPAPAIDVGPRWYAGDFHMHTVESDGTPSIEELLDFAESRGLDFVMLSEHNTTSQLSFYADAQRRHPDLLLIPGTEFTSYAGHANMIGTTDWIDHRPGVRGATIAKSFRDVHDQNALVSINHPDLNIGDACIGCGWMHPFDPLSIDAVEVLNGFFPGASFWEAALALGSHAAATGGSDDHAGGQGSGALYSPVAVPTTMVLADELSVEAILRAIRNGRTVVKARSPDGPMIETTLPGPRRRDTVFAGSGRLQALVTGGQGATLQTIRNGALIESVPVDADPFVHQLAVDAPSDGEDRYRHQLVQGAAVAIGSHVWLREPRYGAGCTPKPMGTCNRPAPARQTVLAIEDDSGGKRDELFFRWFGGSAAADATFGDPTSAEGYALCLYDDSERSLIAEAAVPAGGDCGKKPCWNTLGREPGDGYSYRDPQGVADGVQKIVLRKAASGVSKAVVAGAGSGLSLPALPLPLPLRAQLQGEHGECWGAVYDSAIQNDSSRFRARAD